MKKISIILILALLIITLISCNSNEVDESDNDGLGEILDPSIRDDEANPTEGVTWESESDSVQGEDHPDTSSTEDAIDSETNDSNVNAEFNESCTNYETNPDESEDPSEIVGEEPYEETKPNESPVESATDESDSVSEAETQAPTEEEPYDGMEIVLPESTSKNLVNEAYTAGTISGYSMAKGSARIIQVSKDNPNIIQIVFETENENILIALNYHRVNENAQWKLITGAPISVIDLTKTEE